MYGEFNQQIHFSVKYLGFDVVLCVQNQIEYHQLSANKRLADHFQTIYYNAFTDVIGLISIFTASVACGFLSPIFLSLALSYSFLRALCVPVLFCPFTLNPLILLLNVLPILLCAIVNLLTKDTHSSHSKNCQLSKNKLKNFATKMLSAICTINTSKSDTTNSTNRSSLFRFFYAKY